MRRTLHFCLGMFSFLCLIAWVLTASAQERPDLIGSWTVPQLRAGVYDDKKYQIQEQTATLVIDKQDGELFTGYVQWSMVGEAAAATDHREPFIGVIGFEEITMVEKTDNGVWRGKLLDKDRLALTYVEAHLEGDDPESVVLSVVFTRKR